MFSASDSAGVARFIQNGPPAGCHRSESPFSEVGYASPNEPKRRVAAAAYCLLQDGDATAALPALRFAIEENPKVAIYQVWLGQALILTGDRAGALAAYRKAAELLPGDESVGNARVAYKYLIDKGLKDLGPSDPPPKGR